MNPSRLRALAVHASRSGVLVLALAAAVLHLQRGLFDPDAFASRLSRSLEDPRVSSLMADGLTSAVLEESPDLTAFRPLVRTVDARGDRVVLTATAEAERRPSPAGPLVLAYFRGAGDGLHLASSRDGLRFTAENPPERPLFRPRVGGKLLRDPCVVLGPDGVFHMVWTTGWWDRGFGLAHSRDLVHWTGETYVPVMEAEPGALNTWAPEIAYDAASRRYVVFWATTIEGRFPETAPSGDLGHGEKRLNHRIYAATSADLADWSPARLFLDPGFNVIDATLFEDGGLFRLFVKDETRTPPAKNLRMLSAEGPQGAFGKAGPPITGDYWAEGPTVYRVGTVVYVLFDRYREKRFGAVRTRDFARWEDVSDLVAVPEGARHGTVIRLEGQSTITSTRTPSPPA